MERRAIVTDFVSANFFNQGSRLYRFLKLVIQRHDQILSQFRSENNIQEKDLFFIFKGGNILRIVSKEFFLEVPQNTSREILNFYSPFFSRSDADFSIMLNPNIPNFDLVYKQLQILAYNEQVKIKNILLSNEPYYFDIFRYNQKYQRKLFSECLSKLEVENISVGKIYFDKGIEYKYPHDYFFDTDKKEIIGSNQSYLFSSINNTFDQTTENGWRTKFSLIRTKVRFIAQNKKGKKENLDGELIDVTIPSDKSSETQSFFENSNYMNEYITQYEMTRKDKSFKFYSYSVKYMIKDIEKILFLQGEYPWSDSKYKKRLNRLFFLYFIEIFSIVEEGNIRIEILKEIRSFYENFSFDRLKITRNYKQLSINKFLDNSLKIQQKKMEKDDEKSFDEMIETVNKNLCFLIESLENIKTYCVTDGSVAEEDVYSISTENYI